MTVTKQQAWTRGIYFSQSGSWEVQDQGVIPVDSSVKVLFLVCRWPPSCCILKWWREREQASSFVSHMAPFSWFNNLSKTPSLIIIVLEIRILTWIWVNTNTQSIAGSFLPLENCFSDCDINNTWFLCKLLLYTGHNLKLCAMLLLD